MRQVPQITAAEAAKLVKDGDVLIAGGFGMTGNPVHLLHALAETKTRELTYVGNNVGEAGLGGGRLLRNGQLKKAIGSFFTSNREAVKAAQDGAIEVAAAAAGHAGRGHARGRRGDRRLLHPDRGRHGARRGRGGP